MNDEADIQDDDDELDGCACEFTDVAATPDEDLPAADGGIAE